MADTVAAPQDLRMAYPWWVTLIQGIAAIVIGALLLWRPATTVIVLVQFLGWFWLISGIFDIVSLFWNRAQWGWKLFSGILGIVVGGFIIGEWLLGAVAVLAAYALLLGVGGIIYGVAGLIKAFQGGGWGMGVLGAFSLLFGIIITFNLLSAALVLPWVMGVLGVAFGIAAVVLSFMIRKAQA